MIKIQDIVSNIVQNDQEASIALSKGYMNFSAYASQIQSKVEKLCKKKVLKQSIVVSLSRISHKTTKTKSVLRTIDIQDITIKTPLTELVFKKTDEVLKNISSLYRKANITKDEFLTLTQSNSEISIICSERIVPIAKKVFTDSPTLLHKQLASIGLSLNKRYYHEPNVTYSLLHKIAQKRIVLAETITTHTEIIFVFDAKDIETMVSLFV
jgi:aspartokinase